MESETKLDELFKKKLCYIKIIGLLKKIKREWDSRLIIKKKKRENGRRGIDDSKYRQLFQGV